MDLILSTSSFKTSLSPLICFIILFSSPPFPLLLFPFLLLTPAQSANDGGGAHRGDSEDEREAFGREREDKGDGNPRGEAGQKSRQERSQGAQEQAEVRMGRRIYGVRKHGNRDNMDSHTQFYTEIIRPISKLLNIRFCLSRPESPR